MNFLYPKHAIAFSFFSMMFSLMIGLPSYAFAQYVWLDEKGIKQYSDMPAPATVPASRILKSAGAALRTQSPEIAPKSAADANASGNATTKAQTQLPMTTAEKNADFQKRKMEQAEKDQKAAEEAHRAADKSKNCERASTYQKTLDSGQRISQQGKDGQRTFLSDAQRAQESRDTKRILVECK
ncbi:MAG: DUF4124 domain-containing protein [Oxalobacteraceae bacterium]